MKESVNSKISKALNIATGLGIPAGEPWFDLNKNNSILLYGVNNFKDFMLLVGALPIIHNNNITGVIGVIREHYSQNELCE